MLNYAPVVASVFVGAFVSTSRSRIAGFMEDAIEFAQVAIMHLCVMMLVLTVGVIDVFILDAFPRSLYVTLLSLIGISLCCNIRATMGWYVPCLSDSYARSKAERLYIRLMVRLAEHKKVASRECNDITGRKNSFATASEEVVKGQRRPTRPENSFWTGTKNALPVIRMVRNALNENGIVNTEVVGVAVGNVTEAVSNTAAGLVDVCCREEGGECQLWTITKNWTGFRSVRDAVLTNGTRDAIGNTFATWTPFMVKPTPSLHT